MAERSIKQCYACKQKFKKEELVDYASEGAKTLHSYCLKCLKEKQEKDRFSQKVCSIFGIKAPGPRIWTERKRLIDTYGYTDNIIIDCLDYIYNVQGRKKLSDSLCLVNPSAVEKMLKYKKEKDVKAKMLVQAAKNETKDYIVPIKENTSSFKTNWEPDDWLED